MFNVTVCRRVFIRGIKEGVFQIYECHSYVVEQTDRGERSYDIYSRLLKDRVVFLGTEVRIVINTNLRQYFYRMFIRANKKYIGVNHTKGNTSK